MERPLEGVNVVELSIAVAGPSCGATLADYGADVIKIEPPGGDSQRWIVAGLGMEAADPYIESPHFYQINRGKRSVCLDLRSEAGMKALETLLSQADVFLSNIRYGSLQSLGLGAEELLQRHPQLVVCPMTGWGMEGPEADKPVYDVAGFWARSSAAASHTLR